jgi:hypothetical protein
VNSRKKEFLVKVSRWTCSSLPSGLLTIREVRAGSVNIERSAEGEVTLKEDEHNEFLYF